MIVITGAAGFIGSVLAGHLNSQGLNRLVLVDDFSKEQKRKNHLAKDCVQRIERDDFVVWLDMHAPEIDFVIHLGARTDTTEFDTTVFDRLNLNYSKAVWEKCATYQLPLIYASSAATYGDGGYGYADDHALTTKLQPLNPYGESKNAFDKWALQQHQAPPFWAGLKFFNVYGPNEYHKGRMASVVYHAYHQISDTGSMKLFRSHRSDYGDGMQLRDFVYVKDVADVIFFLMNRKPANGLYNLGTGKARTFVDLANACFLAMKKPPVISFIDTPEDIRDKYQYFTEADMRKLRNIGYRRSFTRLEDGIEDYVLHYLETGSHA